MSEKFKRRYRLTVGAPNPTGATTNLKKSVVIENLHIEFDIKYTVDSKHNSADIKIYNLSADTISIFDVKDCYALLEVAYSDDNLIPLFKGDISHVLTVRQETEVITTLTAHDGFVQSREGKVQKSLPEGAKLTEVINSIVKEGYPKVKTVNINVDTDKVYNNGYSASGGAKKALDDICKSNNLYWNIEGDTIINVLPKSGTTKREALLLTPQNGLISTPEKKAQEMENLEKQKKKPPENGIRFKCLLNPAIRVGGLVTLQGTFKTDGSYRVDTIHHQGGYETDEWTTEVDAAIL